MKLCDILMSRINTCSTGDVIVVMWYFSFNTWTGKDAKPECAIHKISHLHSSRSIRSNTCIQ